MTGVYLTYRALVHLLERSVVHGEGNSVLLTGARGVGKRWVGYECDGRWIVDDLRVLTPRWLNVRCIPLARTRKGQMNT